MRDPLNQPINPFTAHQSKEEYNKALEEIYLALEQKTLAVFNSTEGDALLDMWDDFFLRQPVIILNSVAGENEMREGRNSFIRKIRATVNRARGIK